MNRIEALSVIIGLAGLASVAGAGAGWGNCGPSGGLDVSGSYRGSRWYFNYNVGSGWGHGGHGSGWGYASGPNSWNLSNDGSRYGHDYWDRHFWNDYYSRYRPYGYATGQIVSASNTPADWSLLPGVMAPGAPGSAPAAPPPPPTILQRAADAMANKQLPEAKALFMEHLKANPDDVEASRSLAMCLIEAKEIDTGLAMLRDLYVIDPTLADRPYNGPAAGQDASRLRDLVTKITPYAHKVKSPSAWLGVVIAMQAEGRNAPALKILARAKDAGLERSVVERFTAALTPPPPAPKMTFKHAVPASAPAPSPVTKAPASPPVPGPTEQSEAPSAPATMPEKHPAPAK